MQRQIAFLNEKYATSAEDLVFLRVSREILPRICGRWRNVSVLEVNLARDWTSFLVFIHQMSIFAAECLLIQQAVSQRNFPCPPAMNCPVVCTNPSSPEQSPSLVTVMADVRYELDQLL